MNPRSRAMSFDYGAILSIDIPFIKRLLVTIQHPAED